MTAVRVLLVTGRDNEWCRFIGHELQTRQRKGQIPADFELLMVDDPKCSVGSGGATLNALLVAVEYLSAKLGHHIIQEDVLTKAQIVIVHTGRLFEFCSLERLFATLPLKQTSTVKEEGSKYEAECWTTVFDYLIDTLLQKLAPAYANGVWVCSSDMLLCVASDAYKSLPVLAKDEILAISVPVSKPYARDHGVFVVNNTGDRVTDIHYQPSLARTDSCSQLAQTTEKVPVVTGVVYLTPAFAAKLLELHVTSPIDGCTYAGLDSGSPPVRLSLFLDVLLSLCCDVNEDRFLAGERVRKQQQTDRFASERSGATSAADGGVEVDLDTQIQRQARAVLWKKLRGAFRLRCAVLKDGFYQHLSVTANQYMRSLRALRSCVAHFDVSGVDDDGVAPRFAFSPFVHAFDMKVNSDQLLSSTSLSNVARAADFDAEAEAEADRHVDENLIINSVVHDASALRGCVVHNSILEQGRILIGDYSFVNGLRDADVDVSGASVQLAPRLAVQAFHVRVGSSVHRVFTVFGTDDRLFVPIAEQNAKLINFCGQPFDAFCARTGLQSADLWPGDITPQSRTLFVAKLFPISDASLGYIEWLSGSSSQSDLGDKWRSADRISLQDLLLRSDLHTELEAVRDAFYTVAQHRLRVVLFECRNADLKRLYRSAVIDNRDEQLAVFLHRLARDEMSVAHPDQVARAFANVAELLAARAGGAGGLRSGPASNREWAPALAALRLGAVSRGVTFLESEMQNWRDSPTRLIRAARHYEAACQIEISKAVRTACAFVRVPVFGSSLHLHSSPSRCTTAAQSSLTGEWITADASARIDLAGGWSDTPPICYELGGAVCNVGVLVDGRKPIGARARLSPKRSADGGFFVACRLGHSDRASANGETIAFRLTRCADLHDFNQPNAIGALLKACLVYTRTIELHLATDTDGQDSNAQAQHAQEVELAEQLDRSFGASLDFEMWSELPAGSGLGGSSILIAAVLAVLWRLRGLAVTVDDIVHGVLNVEQLMTTGGGWQDQIGAVVSGGVKIGRSNPGLPLHVTFESVSKSGETEAFLKTVFEPRMMLVYTGKTRLARNLLQDVLRNWYARDETIYSTEKRLMEIAETCFTAFRQGDLATVAECINEYWRLKKIMAPGSEPERVTRMLEVIREHTLAATLCGAGGGGFLFVLLRDPAERKIVETKLAGLNIPDVSVHGVTIDYDGLLVR